jgi:oligopeptide/dipeptide ABC transporter ATP-binding protein
VTAQEQPAGKLTFTVGIVNDVDSLNPFIGILAETDEVWALMYDCLVGYSEKDFSPVPGLAESWEVSADELTWTYKIRQGVKWSDGQPVTAKDAAYTFNRIMKGTFELTNYGNYVSNIKTVEAPDDATLVMTTRSPARPCSGWPCRACPSTSGRTSTRRKSRPSTTRKCRRLGPVRARRAQHRPVRAPDGQQVLYTRALLSVVPEVHHLETQILSGEPPDPTRVPGGCRFHPRCPALASGAATRAGVDDRCRTEPVPILRGVAEHHAACFLTDESVKLEGGDRVGR